MSRALIPRTRSIVLPEIFLPQHDRWYKLILLALHLLKLSPIQVVLTVSRSPRNRRESHGRKEPHSVDSSEKAITVVVISLVSFSLTDFYYVLQILTIDLRIEIPAKTFFLSESESESEPNFDGFHRKEKLRTQNLNVSIHH